MSTVVDRTGRQSVTEPTIEEAEAGAEAARGSWFSALTYDAFLRRGERAGMAVRRRGLLATARGSVLELGAGTGLNLAHYPAGLDRVVLTEPEKHMTERLQGRVDSLGGGRAIGVVRAPAEVLPFGAGTFDTVVSTLVLCTVEDPRRTLAEVRRVLRPDGCLLFLEHVRADDTRLGSWQDRLSGVWQSLGDGCRCNQPTLDLLHEAEFSIASVDRAEWRHMPPILRPLVCGQARPT